MLNLPLPHIEVAGVVVFFKLSEEISRSASWQWGLSNSIHSLIVILPSSRCCTEPAHLLWQSFSALFCPISDILYRILIESYQAGFRRVWKGTHWRFPMKLLRHFTPKLGRLLDWFPVHLLILFPILQQRVCVGAVYWCNQLLMMSILQSRQYFSGSSKETPQQLRERLQKVQGLISACCQEFWSE